VDKETGKIIPNMYSNLDGLQRLTCLTELEKTECPCMIRSEDLSEEDEFAIQYILNKHRVKSNPREELEHVKKFMFRHPELSRDQIADVFCMTYPQLSKLLGLDNLVDEAKTFVEKGNIKPTAAFALCSLPKEYQHEVKMGENIESPIKLAMSMDVNSFISYCKNLKLSINKARKAGSTTLENVINPQPVKRNELLNMWTNATHEIETTDKDTDNYPIAIGRLQMIEEVLQVDAGSLARIKEAKVEKRKEGTVDRAKKRKEEADKQYELAMRTAKEEEANKPLAESLA
jgi:hypothetical protein